MMSKLKFIIFESVRGFLYARTPVLLSLVTIGISLIVISLSSYSYLMFINYSSSFTNDYKLEVFFNSDLNISDSEEIFNRILTFDPIIDGEFIDKEKSSIKFNEFFNEKVESILGENPLPYSGEFLINEKYRTVDSLIIFVHQYHGKLY